MSKDFDLGSLEGSASGLDAFFNDNPAIVSPSPLVQKEASQTRVASLDQLKGFVRTASDTLIHKSTQDLWTLQKDAKGDFYIQRAFDSAGDPVKGA